MKRILLLAATTLALVGSAAAQGVTVSSLLAERAEVKGVIPMVPGTGAGPGILLETFGADGNKLYLCFVAETPSSEAIETQYCKQVR